MAYATINHKEFFSELSVAFLSDHYKYLEKHVKEDGIIACSPPALDAIVVQRISHDYTSYTNSTLYTIPHASAHDKWWQRMVKRRHGVDCCNKFFPFVRCQLRSYDRPTYSRLEALWGEVDAWKDPHRNEYEGKGIFSCC